MQIERNEPCPCGSGRKYKRCCQAREARESRDARRMGMAGPLHIPAELLAGLDRSEAWEVDVTPLPGTIDGRPETRLAMTIVATQGVLLHAQLEDSPTGEPVAVATLLAAALAAAERSARFAPPSIVVRHAEVAEALTGVLGGHIAVVPRRGLDAVDDVARFLRRQAADGGQVPPPVAGVGVWAGWRLPEPAVRRLFEAAAAFHRAAPWRNVGNLEPIRLAPGAGSGTGWWALVLGAAGEEFGVSLLRDEEDLAVLASAATAEDAFEQVRGAMVTILLQPREEIPREMQREIARAGWEVAATDAYPSLLTLHAPGAGMPHAWALETADALEAIGRWALALERELEVREGPVPAPWRDEPTGFTVTLVPFDDAEEVYRRPAEARLTPCGPSGWGAEPGVRFREEDGEAGPDAERETLIDGFAMYLGRTRSSQELTERSIDAAHLLLDYLRMYAGVPARAITELDLRIFLHDWLPRKVQAPKGELMRIPPALRRFFRFLEEVEGIECPWARPVLMDRAEFVHRIATAPGMFFWDEGVAEWRQEVTRDLADRVMLPSPELGKGVEWGGMMGHEEAELHGELLRLWLVWRDEAIASGIDEPDAVWEWCVERQRAWAAAPHEEWGGKPPVEVVRREQRRRKE